jgi:hypothetical protein
MTKLKDMVNTFIKMMEQSILVNGLKINRMVEVEKNGLMVLILKVSF